jgi:hypothetical protein
MFSPLPIAAKFRPDEERALRAETISPGTPGSVESREVIDELAREEETE